MKLSIIQKTTRTLSKSYVSYPENIYQVVVEATTFLVYLIYLRPTNVDELHLLAGIATPDIRRNVCAIVEKKKQETNAAHSIQGQIPAETQLKREFSLSSVRPSDFHVKVIRCTEWQHRHTFASHNCSVNLNECLSKGHTSHWTSWRSTGYALML